jgi:predicted ATPase
MPLPKEEVDATSQAKFVQYYTVFLLVLAESLAAINRVEEGIEIINEALAGSESNEERWCAPELLRVKGELILQAGHLNAADRAEKLFAQSLRLAHKQQALSWELRAAASNARLQRREGRLRDGSKVLARVYSRFFATRDLAEAKALLNSLH